MDAFIYILVGYAYFWARIIHCVISVSPGVGISMRQRIHFFEVLSKFFSFDQKTIVQILSNLHAKLKFRICNCFL